MSNKLIKSEGNLEIAKKTFLSSFKQEKNNKECLALIILLDQFRLDALESHTIFQFLKNKGIFIYQKIVNNIFNNLIIFTI